MLDLMRRKKRLKLVLWLVIIALALTMMIFFIPGMDMGGMGTTAQVAEVDGRSIPTDSFVRFYNRTVDRISSGGRNKMDRKTLQAMGLPRQVLDDLITTKVVEILAERLGVGVTDEEIRRLIETHPSLQDQGKFIGVDRYKELLAANQYTVNDFENDQRRLLLLDKTSKIIASSISVGQRELREEFARNTQKTQLDFVLLKKEDYRKRVKPTEAELKAYFDAHRDAYRVGEKRDAEYLLISAASMLPDVTATEQDIRAEWNQHPHEETVEAAHILFRVENPEEDTDIRKKAEAVLQKVQSGEDFSKLAKSHSDDPGSASNGGYLGPFQRGQLAAEIAEFENAAFALDAGQSSDLVRTKFGYHIIKVLRRETPTLESNRPGLEAMVLQRKAQELARKKAQEAAQLMQGTKDLQRAAQKLGTAARIQKTGLFQKEDNPLDFGISQALRDEVFELKEMGTLGKPVEHPLGFALPRLTDKQPARAGRIEEFRGKVESDYLDYISGERMQADAKALAEAARKQGNLEMAARNMGANVRRSQEFDITGTPDPEIGANTPLNKAAFALEPGAVGDPQPVMDNMVVFQIRSRTPFDEEAFQRQRGDLEKRMLQSLQDLYFQEYLRKMREDLEKNNRVTIDNKLLERVALSNY